MEAGTGIGITELANTITISADTSADKNGYYGGNLGNGGNGTIPSSTISTITNQMTFYKPGVTDFDDLTPLRLVVDSGNESPMMAFRQGNDSMLVKRSDTEFYFRSNRGIVTSADENVGLVAGGIVTIQGDSILIQTVPNAYNQEKTVLMLSHTGAITKRETGAINEYTTPGTYTLAVPSGATSFSCVVVGAGGGGGSGRKGAAGENRYGGGGGAGGSVSIGDFSLSSLGNPANITVEVGAGGAGGASRTVNGQSGAAGTNGQPSLVRINSVTILTASGGTGGAGGTTSSGTGGVSGSLRGDFVATGGGNGTNAAGSAASQATGRQPGSGGGGGGLNTSNATAAGGSGSQGYYSLVSGGTGGNGAGAAGSNAGTGQYGGGGGAGGGTVSAVRADGGAGGYPGGGAGGGNGGINDTYDSGKGGDGANGYAIIIWQF